MDSDCYYVKLCAHVQREVAAKPELIQIETAYRSAKERQPGTLSRNEYTDLEAPKMRAKMARTFRHAKPQRRP